MFESRPPRPLGPDFTTSIFTRIGVDRFTRGSSPLGPVFIAWSGRGVCAIRLAGGSESEAPFADWYRERIGRRVVAAVEVDGIARAAQTRLLDTAAADVPLDLESATPFERRVLAAVAQIRFGYARPYALIARELDEPCAPQTVADILASNAVPLLVPCHRVVRSDRCCSPDYVFGPDAQRQLLGAEGVDAAAVDAVIARGIAYIENNGEFCLPTCGDIAGKVDLPGYFGLRSYAEVQARGLRACESCRPLAA